MIIARLQGMLVDVSPTSVIIDVKGVGYKVGVSTFTSGKLPSAGSEVTLHIFHHITEVSQQLFGFYSTDELQVFEQLITVKGVGPKVALGILSGMDPVEFRQTVSSGNKGALSGVPGIGKKTAERIIVELQDKLGPANEELAVGDNTSTGNVEQEAVDALVALGYPSSKAQKAVKQVTGSINGTKNASELVKTALKVL